jgi:hypothetical protein
MKVTGFSFVRNAIKFDYPIIEAISSILPICDDFIIAVGNSNDNTLELIKSINSDKIKVIETVWDDSLLKEGKVLAVETDKAFQAVPSDSDWAFYIQGDEVVHEKYLGIIYSEMLRWKNDENVDGLLFNYKHFFGSYDYVGMSTRWYRNEIRVIKNNKKIYSYRDAQGFRKNDNEKLNVKPIDAYIYHYGWVKHPKTMQTKCDNYQHLYFGNTAEEQVIPKKEEFDYSEIDALSPFNEEHPKVMGTRILQKNWKFDYDLSTNKLSLKHRVKLFMKNKLGIYIGYKNYKVI